jgi:hypothetical protein
MMLVVEVVDEDDDENPPNEIDVVDHVYSL